MLDRLEKFMYDLVECGFGVPLMLLLLPLYCVLKIICSYINDIKSTFKNKEHKE